MVKIILLVLSVALFKNSSCFGLFGNVSGISDVVKEVITKKEHLNINGGCMEQLVWFAENLVSVQDGFWALKMIDASAKMSSGIMTLNVAWLGDYDECLAIESHKKDVKGKYCLISLTSSKPLANHLNQLQVTSGNYTRLSMNRSIEGQLPFLPSAGICIPDKCNGTDIKNSLHMLTSIPVSVSCQTKDDLNQPWDLGSIYTIGYFGFFVLLMTLSTIYDLCRDQKTTAHPLMVAFSTYSNGKKLFKISKTPNQLTCLNGIRFLSMLWVIVGHEFISYVFRPLVNLVDVIKYLRTTRGMFFTNGVYSVDTFFVVGGFLVVYNFMKTNSQGHKFNIGKFYWHRYLRLTHPLIPVLKSTIFLMKYLGSGPFYPQTEIFSRPCRQHWWSTLLYIQNYVNIDDRCLGHTWYINVDWQLYLMAPAFLLFLPKRPKIGLTLMLSAIVGSMLSSFLITWHYKLESLQTNVNGDLWAYTEKYYMMTYTRAAPWLIGAVLGYILGKIKFQNNLSTVQLPKWLIGSTWIIVLTGILACIFAGADTLNSDEYHPYSNAFYNTFAKPAWGVCIAWIIFACSLGYGGVINTVLSLPIFQVLNRFTYSMYLLHHMILYMIALSQKQPGYYSLFNVAYSFWGIFALTFGLSIFWVLAFESPAPMVEKCISGSIANLLKKKQQIGSGTDTETLISSNPDDTDDLLPRP